ncbi:MAG: CHAT domain-containing tetratricopeptide repeat protein [Ekhidna sp.]|uniref:CHAT domain-containing protein n=1 Tax=Ekhidna sp. TaxID=2608089 RepID=UPI0032ECAECB
MKNVLACIIFSMVIHVCPAQNINSLIAQAEESLVKNHWLQAEEKFQSILDKYVDDLTYLQRANIYNHLGFLSLQLLDPIEAERKLNLALLYHEEAGIPNQKDYADALLNMGILYLEQVEFDLSRRYIQKSLEILEELPNSDADYWIARSKLAYLYEQAGSITLALSIYDESYDQLVASGNDLSPDFAEICSHKGRILILTGNSREGEEFINLSTTIYESLGKDYDVRRAESLEKLAVFYEKMGRFADAEKTLLTALKIKRSIPDEAKILIIETLNDLGIMYHDMGQFDKAGEMFTEVVKECEANVGTDHPYYATAKNNLGTLALASGNVSEALDMFTDALANYKVNFGTMHPYYANTLNNLARVERKLGNNEMAEKYYMEVLQIDEKVYGKRHPDYATTLINVGVLYSSIGKEVEAEKYYREAVDIREEVLGVNHPAYGNALEYMGMHSLMMGKRVEAEQCFRKSIQIQVDQIELLFPIMTDHERQIFHENIRSNIDRYNYIAIGLLDQNPELIKTIFDFQLHTKSVLFNTSYKVHEEVAESEDFELKQKYQKWQSDKRLIASYHQMGVAELDQLNINLSYEESKLERLESEIVAMMEDFAGALQRVEGSWKSIHDFVAPGEAIVEIIRVPQLAALTGSEGTLFGFTGQTQYLAVVFTHDSDMPRHVNLSNNFMTDDQHFNIYKASLLQGDGNAFSKLWEPIDKVVGKVTSVKIIPDGIYNEVNPNALKMPDGKYVIDKYYVSYLTSARDLFVEEAQIFNKKSYLVGNPSYSGGQGHTLELSALAASADEINEIQGALSEGWDVKTYLGNDANELRVRSAFNPTVLHIAAHGFFNDIYKFISSHSPIHSEFFSSGIFLTGASETITRFEKGIQTIPENDGILTTYEAMNLNLHRTQLVVLSACELGWEDSENGAGVYGLHRALTVAGARNIITSLTKIEDEAIKELMGTFYKKFNETNKVKESLKYAQLKLREKYNDPKVWGAFILTGKG